MIELNSLLQWHSAAVAAWAGALKVEDDVVEDTVVLDRESTPDWLQKLPIPHGWRRIELFDQPAARVTVRGAADNGAPEAAETVSVFGYTRRPQLQDVTSIGPKWLRELGAIDVVTKALAVPSREGTAVARTSGIALTGDQRIWVQHTCLVAGSNEQHAGRLILHNIFVDGVRRATLGGDVAEVSDAMHRAFVAWLG